MSDAYREREAAVLAALLPNLEAEGYQVFVEPSPMILPPFLHATRPDAIAIRPDRKLAIEIVPNGEAAGDRVRRLHAAFSTHPEWEFRVIYAPPLQREPAIEVATRDAIIANLDRVLDIYDASVPVAGLLTGWAVFEAAARTLMPEQVGRPQAPAQLLERLAFEGFVTPDEADHLRRLAQLRNKAAHGGLAVAVTREDMGDLVQATRAVLAQAPGGLPP
jgi:hypothetical protein